MQILSRLENRRYWQIVYWVLLGIFIKVNLTTLSFHEQWRDEAQAWLLVRDMDIGSLLHYLPNEVHPPLWYLLIMPLAKLGFAYQTQGILSILIMAAALYIFLLHTTLPFYLKITLVFSYYFAFEYSVIARNYCLVVLFTALVLALYEKRFDKPWPFALAIAGLFNSHVVVFTFAGSITIIYFFDLILLKKRNKNIIGAFILMVASGAYLIPYFFSYTPMSLYLHSVSDHTTQIGAAINNAFFVYDKYELLSLILFAGFCILLFNTPKALFILLGGAFGVFYILGYKYVGGLRHQGILLVIILGSFGIADHYTPKFKLRMFKATTIPVGLILLTAIFLYQLRFTIAVYKEDKEKYYSDAKGAAEFIRREGLEGAILIGHPSWAASAILPFLSKATRFYYPDCERFGSYVTIDSCYVKNNLLWTSDYAAQKTILNFADKITNTVLVLTEPIQHSELGNLFQLIYSTVEQPIKKDEGFYIYKYTGPFPLQLSK